MDAVKPTQSGQRQFIERPATFLLARSLDHDPAGLLLIYRISWEWLEKHSDVKQKMCSGLKRTFP